MKSVINEYTGAILALVGVVCILSMLRSVFFGNESFFAVLITAAVQGGF